MNIKVIKTRADYQAALAVFSAMMDEVFAPGSDRENEFELLALVLDAYERKLVEPARVDAVEAILFRMDQLGLNRHDMVKYLGSKSKVSEVLARKRPLSLNMVRRLHEGLKIPLDILIGVPDETAYLLASDANREALERSIAQLEAGETVSIS